MPRGSSKEYINRRSRARGVTVKHEIDPPVLEVEDLHTSFDTDTGPVPVVDGVSLRVPRGKTVALVGESGCGKSVTALSIMRLIPQPPGRIVRGRILFRESSKAEPVDLPTLDERALRSLRGKRIAMIFQEPRAALNPVCSVGAQIIEALELHRGLRGRPARAAAVEMLRQVGIPVAARRVDEYPHQLSGGMCQRVLIAMALAGRPALLIADEPTTALDVTVQLQILELLRELQNRRRMGIIFITHDLGVVAEIADYVYVMYAGRIVEHAPVGDLFAEPLHPYTRGLLRCLPRLSQQRQRLEVIPGSVPDPAQFPSGCRFHPRCRFSAERAGAPDRKTSETDEEAGRVVLPRCVEAYAGEPSGAPPLIERRPEHFVACWETDAAPESVAGRPTD